MYIADEPLLTDNDIYRYFGGCFLRDPHTGLPAHVVTISSQHVEVVLYPEEGMYYMKSYTGSKLVPYLSLDTYKIPPLGWREWSRPGRTPIVVHLERQAQSGGVRGLNMHRLQRMYPEHLPCNHSIIASADQLTSESIIRVMFGQVPQRSLSEIIPRLLENQHAILNSKLAALRVYNSTKFVLMYDRSEVGVGDVGTSKKNPSLELRSPRIQKLLGDCDGIEVKIV